MSIRWPHRIPLARVPTPLERLEDRAGSPPAELWVKRDDLTGIALSGNKVRKLEWLCAEARAEQADVLITCGGVNSNHARATAVAAAQLGLRAHLVLRGEDRRPPRGNLLLDRVLGTDLTFITPDQWDNRDALMEEIAMTLKRDGHHAYVIPEGGSNATGSLGYARAAHELLAQAEAQGLGLQRIFHACGSAGTTAGLALGLAAAGREDVDVRAVAVCNDRPYFDARVNQILDEAVERGFVAEAVRARARWTIVEGFKGEGYAKTTPDEMRAHAALARSHGLFVDPVYTGKAFLALRAAAEAGELDDGGTVFLHTGGIFELFGFDGEIDALASDSHAAVTRIA